MAWRTVDKRREYQREYQREWRKANKHKMPCPIPGCDVGRGRRSTVCCNHRDFVRWWLGGIPFCSKQAISKLQFVTPNDVKRWEKIKDKRKIYKAFRVNTKQLSNEVDKNCPPLFDKGSRKTPRTKEEKREYNRQWRITNREHLHDYAEARRNTRQGKAYQHSYYERVTKAKRKELAVNNRGQSL